MNNLSGQLAMVARTLPRDSCTFYAPVSRCHPDTHALVVIHEPIADGSKPLSDAAVEHSVTGSVTCQRMANPDGTFVTLQYWPAGQVEALLAMFTASVPTQEQAPPEPLDQELLRRIATGVAITNANQLAVYKQTLFAGSYALWYAETRKYMAENSLEDVAGLISVRDFQSSALCAYQAFNMALEARLALEWDLSPVQEDFVRRIETSGLDPAEQDAALDVLLMRQYFEDAEGWVSRAARTTERMLITVEQHWFS